MDAIPEFEVIEQIMDEPRGRSVRWLMQLDSKMPRARWLQLLEGMWKSGKVALNDAAGRPLTHWEAAAFFRASGEGEPTWVVATEAGLDGCFPRD